MTPWNAVLRALMSLPDADALKAHVDGLGEYRADLAIHGANHDPGDREHEQGKTQNPEAHAQLAMTLLADSPMCLE